MYSIIILEKIPGKLISFKIEILIEKILETKVEPIRKNWDSTKNVEKNFAHILNKISEFEQSNGLPRKAELTRSVTWNPFSRY